MFSKGEKENCIKTQNGHQRTKWPLNHQPGFFGVLVCHSGGDNNPGDIIPGDMYPRGDIAPGDTSPLGVIVPGDIYPRPRGDIVPGDSRPLGDIVPGDLSCFGDILGDRTRGDPTRGEDPLTLDDLASGNNGSVMEVPKGSSSIGAPGSSTSSNTITLGSRSNCVPSGRGGSSAGTL